MYILNGQEIKQKKSVLQVSRISRQMPPPPPHASTEMENILAMLEAQKQQVFIWLQK